MRKAWRWAAGGLLLVGAAGLLGGLASWLEPAAVAAPGPASAVAVTISTSAPREGTAAVSQVAQAAAASRPAPPEARASSEFIDICGAGRVRRSELDSIDGSALPVWAREMNRLSEQGLPDMLKRLDAGSLRQRVAAAALRGDAQSAARLAAQTDDAGTYRIALRACRKDEAFRALYPAVRQQQAQLAASAASGAEMPELQPPGPVPTACAAIHLERLELLDPGDAWPWLLRLSDGITRGDEAGISQALYQVAQRPRVAPHTRLLSAVVAEAAGAEPTPGESWALVAALSIDMDTLLDGALANVGRPCRAEALKDANRRQLCEQVVRGMPSMAREAVDARMLHVLEERLGLPHSPQALSRADFDRGLKALGEESTQWISEPSCANFAKLGQQVAKLAREGELAPLRAYLAAHPASGPR